jgi:hypothetical protein
MQALDLPVEPKPTPGAFSSTSTLASPALARCMAVLARIMPAPITMASYACAIGALPSSVGPMADSVPRLPGRSQGHPGWPLAIPAGLF